MNPALTRNERFAGSFVDGHHGRIAEKSSEFDRVAYVFAYYGNNANRSCFLIYHSYRGFVRNNSRYCRRRCIAGNCYHVKPDGANAGHRFKFFYCQISRRYSVYHALIFADGNNRAAETTNIGRRHNTAFFDLVVEQRERRRRAGCADAFKPYFFKYLRHAVSHGRSGRERQVDYSERNAEPF